MDYSKNVINILEILFIKKTLSRQSSKFLERDKQTHFPHSKALKKSPTFCKQYPKHIKNTSIYRIARKNSQKTRLKTAKTEEKR